MFLPSEAVETHVLVKLSKQMDRWMELVAVKSHGSKRSQQSLSMPAPAEGTGKGQPSARNYSPPHLPDPGPLALPPGSRNCFEPCFRCRLSWEPSPGWGLGACLTFSSTSCELCGFWACVHPVYCLAPRRRSKKKKTLWCVSHSLENIFLSYT